MVLTGSCIELDGGCGCFGDLDYTWPGRWSFHAARSLTLATCRVTLFQKSCLREVTIGLVQTYITFYGFSIHAMATVTTLPITIAAPATNWQKPAATGKIAGEFDEPPRRTKLLNSSPDSRPNLSQSRSAFPSTQPVLPTSLLPGVVS